MGLPCFDSQKVDYIGDLAVKLEYFSIVMFITTLGVIIDLAVISALTIGFLLPLPFSAFLILTIPIGFVACWRRSHVLALIYILTGGVALFLLMLAQALLLMIMADVAAACGADNDCNFNNVEWKIPTLVFYALCGISYLLAGITVAVGIKALPRFWKLRQKLLQEMRDRIEAERDERRENKMAKKRDQQEGQLQDDDMLY